MLVTIEAEIPDGWELADRKARPPRNEEFWVGPGGRVVFHSFPTKFNEYRGAIYGHSAEPRIIVRPKEPAVRLDLALRDRHTKAAMKFLGKLPCGRLAFGLQSPMGTWGTTSCNEDQLEGRAENFGHDVPLPF